MTVTFFQWYIKLRFIALVLPSSCAPMKGLLSICLYFARACYDLGSYGCSRSTYNLNL